MNINEQLKRDEGVRGFPYTDTAGKLTIGVGRNLTDVGIFPDEIDYLLQKDIDRATATLLVQLPWFHTLDDARQGVLVNMCFNMGWKGLSGFQDTLSAFERGDWEAAATHMLDSLWAKQVNERANRLAEQVRTGVWQ